MVLIVYYRLKSQFVTSSWGGTRKLPLAFTEQGIYMLATVLRGDVAEQQSIYIMRAFREMRHLLLITLVFVVYVCFAFFKIVLICEMTYNRINEVILMKLIALRSKYRGNLQT